MHFLRQELCNVSDIVQREEKKKYGNFVHRFDNHANFFDIFFSPLEVLSGGSITRYGEPVS